MSRRNMRLFAINNRSGHISPPDLSRKLSATLRTKYPNTDFAIVRSVAANIDRHVRSLVRSQYSIKVGRKPRYWAKQSAQGRSQPIAYTLRRRPSAVSALRRLRAAALSKSERVWAKAWHELPYEALALLEAVAGADAVWGKVPAQRPLDPRWKRTLTKAGFVLPPEEPLPPAATFALNLAGAPIPHPSTVLQLISKALQSASKDQPKFLRNIHIAGIVRAFERLTGTKATMPSHKGGSSLRRGPIVDFLNCLEAFYSEQYSAPFSPLYFGVQNSGSAWSNIFAL